MVSTAEEGAFADQGDYKVRGREGWEIAQVANGNISGTVRSHSAGKGQLEIHYKNILQNTSPDEIAFAHFDLAIAKYGNTGHLTEDRLPQNQVAAPPHEMNPGGIVIAPPAGSNSPPMRTRLTITGNRPAIAGGSYTLSAANALTKLRLYPTQQGGDPIELPKTFSANELTEPLSLYIGSEAFEAEEPAQTGQLTLTHQLPLLADGAVHELKDEVMVSLLPVEVVELSPKVKDEDGNDIAGSEKPNSGKPLTPFVEVDPNANKIAHREIKVKIGDVLKDKKVTWTLEALLGATPATIRGDWDKSPNHKDRFELSTAYDASSFSKVSQTTGETKVGADGHTAIRVNVPPIGFNQVRIKIQIEGVSTPIDLIDMEVPGVVVIDPGHGGTDSGTEGLPDHTILEKDLTLAYGLKLREELIERFKNEKHGLRVKMTRKVDDRVELEDRAPFAKNEGADVFVSLHFNNGGMNDNGTPNTSARGTETFVERTPGNHNLDEDATLARSLQTTTVAAVQSQDAAGKHRLTFDNNWVLDAAGNPIPGVKRAGFLVTKDGVSNNGNTNESKPVKACLIEVEFLTNATALDSLKLSGGKGGAIKDAFAENAAADIFNNILNQP